MTVQNNTLTQARLKELLHYDPDTGIFTWLVSHSRTKAGTIAGSSAGQRYVTIQIYGVRYFAHRLVFLYMIGRFPEHEGYHDDHDSLNNRWGNLYEATSLENQYNKKKYSNNKSVVTGVNFRSDRKKWRSTIVSCGGLISLGQYTDWFDAVCARKSGEVRYDYHPNHGT